MLCFNSIDMETKHGAGFEITEILMHEPGALLSLLRMIYSVEVSKYTVDLEVSSQKCMADLCSYVFGNDTSNSVINIESMILLSVSLTPFPLPIESQRFIY